MRSKILIALFLAQSFLFTISCNKYDDSALWQAINRHSEEIAALKEKCNNLYITSCTPLSDGSGYTVVFYSGQSIVIRNGEDGRDGKDGLSPQIGIDKFTDGFYYWTLNGEWLLDKEGKMIRADGEDGKDGEDGITPKLKIEDGDWYVSTDNGVTWSNLGKASGSDGKDGKDGDSLFQSVIPGTEFVTFILADGTELKVPYFGQSQGNVAITGEYSDLTSNSVTVYGWCYLKEEEGLSGVYGFEYSDTDLTSAARTVKAESKDDENKFCCEIKSLNPETKYYYRAFSYFNGVYSYGEVKIFTTAEHSCPSGAVDLGLSVCWATCKLGASNPEECGSYFQWAGTNDVASTSIYLDWDNCPYHTGSEMNKGWTKYNTKSSYGTADNKIVIDSDDDVAHIKLGGSWRIPTDAEWTELMDNCTWTWTERNEVTGYEVTSKRPGYTDKSIFLPTAGYRSLGCWLRGVGSDGFYWSSSLDTDYPYNAYRVRFNQDDIYIHNYYRYDGQSVRPVSE